MLLASVLRLQMAYCCPGGAFYIHLLGSNVVGLFGTVIVPWRLLLLRGIISLIPMISSACIITRQARDAKKERDAHGFTRMSSTLDG